MSLLLKGLSGLILGLALITAMASEAAAANDKGRNWNNGRGHPQQKWNHREHREWRERDNREWRYHEYRARNYWVRPQPRTVYAPPIVYYQEPLYAEPSLNLIFPLSIR
jgi:hypothetical protein